MTQPLNRRSLLAGTPLAIGTLLLDPTRAGSEEPAGAPGDRYPVLPEAEVREVVGASHFSLERVRALVDRRPELAKSAWDWGFGDWESALGAAAHTGNRDIAEYLIEHGARPNLFSAAMLGDLAVVKAFVDALPGIQSQPGPHGIPLRRHAELGGEPAREVLAYLDELGGADARPADEPLPIERDGYLGRYVFGSGPNDAFEVTVGRMDNLMIQRGEGTARALLHQGDHAFQPAGAPSVTIRFRVEGGTIEGLEIHHPELLVSARTVSSGSRVPPAVTTTLQPASVREPRAHSAWAAIASGSAIRPSPCQPQARSPASGPTRRTPRARSVAAFACVAGCCHMFTFMAGATSTGARVASSTAVTRSSASPCAMRASVCAVAGATTTSSAQSASAM